MKIKNQTSAAQPSLSRRQLLKTGFIGATVLSTIHLTACSSHAIKSPFNQNKASPYQFLTKDDAIMLSAILPAMMAHNWPSEEQAKLHAEAETLQRIDLFLSRLGHFNLSEVRKLFDLLQLTPARGLTTGIWKNWENTTPEDIDHFLNRWKFSSLNLLNSGYNALSDILCFAWYTNPSNTDYAGYSGPPNYALESLPQFQMKINTDSQMTSS
jgi:hypothetical protein